MADGNLIRYSNQVQAPANSDAGMAIIDADYTELGNGGRVRRRRGFVTEIANGMSGVFWMVRNPSKTLFRAFGGFSALCGLAAVIGGMSHFIAGQPGTARMNSAVDPVGVGKVVADWTRPTVVRGAQFLDASLNNPNRALLLDNAATQSESLNTRKTNYRR